MLFYILQILFSYLFSDFYLGIYHWLKDSYFSPFTPLIGKYLIWGSRLHHIKPHYVTEFSDSYLFFESILWNASWIVPILWYTRMHIFWLATYFFISINEIVHKYAHLTEMERPILVNLLQKYYVIQSHEEHRLHHLEPYNSHYCPLTPYLNFYLEKINFWRNLESLISYFGYYPRKKTFLTISSKGYPCNLKMIPVEDVDDTNSENFYDDCY